MACGVGRSGRQVLDAAGDPGRVAAAAVVGAGGGGGARQEVRHGAEHQDGAHEADAGAPAAADGLAAHAGAAAAGAGAHVQVVHDPGSCRCTPRSHTRQLYSGSGRQDDEST